MKLPLICFGYSHLPEHAVGGHRPPRLAITRLTQQFLPDYSLLLLADEIIMDRHTYAGLVRGQIEAGPTLALLTKLLHDEGFIRLENFDAVLQEQAPLLEQATAVSLQTPSAWLPVMKASVANWKTFFEGLQWTLLPRIQHIRQEVAAGKFAGMDYTKAAKKFVHDVGGRMQMVNFYAEDAQPEDAAAGDDSALRSYLTEHLYHAQANLFLCARFGAALHNWCDFQPYYDRVLQVGEDAAAQPVFALSVPEFIFWDPDTVIRVLRSQLVQELRERVRVASAGTEPFDTTTAARILADVARTESGVVEVRRLTATRNAVPSFATGAPTSSGGFLSRWISHSIDAEVVAQKHAERFK